MSFTSLMVDDVVLVRPTLTTDRNHNQVASWTSPVRTRIKGWLSQLSAVELIQAGRDAGMSMWTLYLPAGTTIDLSYRVEVDGVTYFVDGPPTRAKTPRGEHHVEVHLRLVEG